jgi:hypothetical protein
MVTIPQQFPSEIVTPASARKSTGPAVDKISTSPQCSMEQPPPQSDSTPENPGTHTILYTVTDPRA